MVRTPEVERLRSLNLDLQEENRTLRRENERLNEELSRLRASQPECRVCRVFQQHGVASASSTTPGPSGVSPSGASSSAYPASAVAQQPQPEPQPASPSPPPVPPPVADRETGRYYAVAAAPKSKDIGIYNRKWAYRAAVAGSEDRGVGRINFAANTDSKVFDHVGDAENWFYQKLGYWPKRIEWH